MATGVDPTNQAASRQSPNAVGSAVGGDLFREVAVLLNRDACLELTRILDEESVLDSLCGYYEVLYEVGRPGSDSTDIRLFFPSDQEDAEIRVMLLLEARGIGFESISTTTLNRDEYLNAYKQHYLPIRPGRRIVIVPSWHRGSPEEQALLTPDTLAVYLDPGLAFGTGRHPTTTMCLQRLEDLTLEGLRVTDAGCGSGILTLAALALGAAAVLAFDIDSNAVRATEQNHALNPARGSLRLLVGGFDLPEFMSTPTDLLLANLAANILVNAASRIDAGPQTRMLLSGILTEQVDQTLGAFPSWTLRERFELDGWALVELARR